MIKLNTDWSSPNFGSRHDTPVSILVLHYTAMADAQATLELFSKTESQVSAHYFITKEGIIHQLVDENDRAWHAGVSHWAGVADVNSSSIGIELDNVGLNEAGEFVAYDERLLASLFPLVADICGRHAIKPQNVVGHSDVAPERKQDPGNMFPWQRLAEQGHALWPSHVDKHATQSLVVDDQGDGVRDVQAKLAHIGYGINADGAYAALTEDCVKAFQRRFRQNQTDGKADPETIDLISAVAALTSA